MLLKNFHTLDIKIFPLSFCQISCNQPACIGVRSEVLILTENETEKERWIATLEELQKAAKQSPNQMSPVFGCREMYTTQQLEILRNCLSADVANSSEFTPFTNYTVHVHQSMTVYVHVQCMYMYLVQANLILVERLKLSAYK